METVSSADGTAIAFDRMGSGPPLIVVGGATCDRARTEALASALGQHFTTLNFDRRGRGDSGDTLPYAAEREIEDVAAAIQAAGGQAVLYGHSSGAGLVLQAAAAGLPATSIVLHEAPYTPADPEWMEHSRQFSSELIALLADDRRSDALDFFFAGTGMPEDMVRSLREAPDRPGQEALAHTLAYDSAVMGDVAHGGAVPLELLGRVTVPALVITGDASPDFFMATGQALTDGLPDGRHLVLEGEGHLVDPATLAPVIAGFATAAG